MKCIGCKTKGTTWWCNECQAAFMITMYEVRSLMDDLGEAYGEGHIVLSMHEMLESERLIELTPLSKAAMLSRAYELLMEVEDYFAHTPTCPGCKTHRMTLETGEPLVASCTGGCQL